MTEQEQKRELVQQIKNRCEVFLKMDLWNTIGWEVWQYTILEDIGQDALQLLEEYCQVKGE